MRSLNAHLVETGSHGHLPFHPDCPVCRRERLSGALSAESVVPLRTQAAVAAGVVALSTATPAVSAAAEPDQQQEGSAALGGSGEAPGFDPGGDTGLPFEVAPPAAGPTDGGGSGDEGDGAPVEAEPVSDPDARLVPAEEPEQPAPVGEEPPTAPAEAQPTPTGPSVGTPAAQQKEREATGTDRASSQADRSKRPRKARARERASQRTAAPRPSAGVVRPAAVPQPTSVSGSTPPAQASGSAAVADAGGKSDSVSPGDRFYVVRRGDSLWSIAKDVLGPGASVLRVAREVNRLWELNVERIGTGDRDLLMAGTKLRLR